MYGKFTRRNGYNYSMSSFNSKKNEYRSKGGGERATHLKSKKREGVRKGEKTKKKR